MQCSTVSTCRGWGGARSEHGSSKNSWCIGTKDWTWTRLVQCGTKERAVAPAASGYAELGNATQQREEQAQQQGEQAQPSVSGRKAPAAIRATPAMLRDVVTMFRTQPLEYDYWVEESMVTGNIPEDLQGTYFRNGPGLQIGHTRYQRHYLDGDGCVLSLAFPGGGQMPRFSNKYVRTKGFVAEQEAGRPLYRNAFTRGAADGSGLFNPLDLSFKNVANTGVLYWAERLWALWEVGRPYELDPRTLDTKGEDDMGGQVGQRMAGHYSVVQEPDGDLRCVCFGTQVSISGTEIEFYEFDTAGQLVVKSKQSLQGFEIMPIHDMLVTEHWYIVQLGPIKFDIWRLLSDYPASKCSLAELMEFDASLPSKIILFPRPGRVKAEESPPGSSSSSSSPALCSRSPGAPQHQSPGRSQKKLAEDDASISSMGYVSSSLDGLGSPAGSGGSSDHPLPALGAPASAPPFADPRTSAPAAPELTGPAGSAAAASAAQEERGRAEAGLGGGGSRGANGHAKHFKPLDLPPPVVIHGPSFFSFHHVNAYEVQGGSQIVMDTIGWQDLRVDVTQHNVTEDYFSSGCRSHLHRLLIDVPAARTLSCTRLLRRTLEFPNMNKAATARPHQHAYFASDAVDDEVAWAPAQVLLKVTLPVPKDAHSSGLDSAGVRGTVLPASGCVFDSAAAGVTTSEWRPGERCFMQEPLFVPRPSCKAEDDGWIIVAVHNAASLKGEIAILDAQRVQDGPVATIRLPHALPYGLHGTWTPTYLGPDPHDPAVPKWREPNRIREL